MKTDLAFQDYKIVKEKVFQRTLTNGLHLVLIPKKDYHDTFAVMTARFGAADTVFKPKNRKKFQAFPEGAAHFLEHRLFDMKEGQDAMQLLSHLGSDVNAFTGFRQTSYYFSCQENLLESLEVLQSFTALSNLRKEAVQREKSIISQEIKMYQDDPDHQLYTSILGQLYPETALAEDIAGSLPSIEKISQATLQACFDVFYHPSNMLLLLVGNFDVDEVVAAVETFQSKRRPRKEWPIDKAPLPFLPVRPSASKEMLSSGPKLAVGLRGKVSLTDVSTLSYRLALRLLFSMLLGWTSSTYQQWYQLGKIDDSFSIEVEVTKLYRFVIITLDTSEPLAMSKRIRQLIQSFRGSKDLTEQHLELVKREFYGNFLQSLNTLEFIATEYASAWVEGEDLFELPDILSQLSLEDVIEVGNDFISGSEMTDFIIFPK